MTYKSILLSALLCSPLLTSTHAAPGLAHIYSFNLTGDAPGGSGLSGQHLNQPGSSSPATGLELNSGISYNDSTHVLTLNFGWGSDAGGVDLSQPFSELMVAGGTVPFYPPVSQLSLDRLSGSFSGTPSLTRSALSIAQQEASLLAGLWHINIFISALLHFRTGRFEASLPQYRNQQNTQPLRQSPFLASGCIGENRRFASLRRFSLIVQRQRSRYRKTLVGL